MASLTNTAFIRNLTAIAAVVIISACGDADATTSPESTDSRTPTENATAAITVAPGSNTVNVGDSAKFTAVVKDASGAVRADVSPVWRTANTSIATVRTDGTVSARATGTTTVTATALGKSATVTLAVVAAGQPTPPPAPAPTPAPTPAPAPSPAPVGNTEPSFTSGVHQALWMDDFNGTANTAGIYSRYATQGSENGLTLEATAGLSGSKALRMDWRAKSGCSDDSHFVEGSFPTAPTEVVVQYSVRYEPGFVFDWIGRNGACSGNAKKLFFLWAGSGSRFDFISENHVLGVGSDLDHPLFSQNVGTALRPEDLADGAWHRITLRVKQSSTPTATDGYIHGWVDGVQKWRVDNIASHASGGWTLFKFPATFNQGSPLDQSEWVDDIKVWRP